MAAFWSIESSCTIMYIVDSNPLTKSCHLFSIYNQPFLLYPSQLSNVISLPKHPYYLYRFWPIWGTGSATLAHLIAPCGFPPVQVEHRLIVHFPSCSSKTGGLRVVYVASLPSLANRYTWVLTSCCFTTA